MTNASLEAWRTVVRQPFPLRIWLQILRAENVAIDDDIDVFYTHVESHIEPETEVELVKASVAEIVQHQDPAPYSEICKAAKTHGLELCPHDIVPPTRLAYQDQPEGEVLSMATKIMSVCGEHCLATIHNFDGRFSIGLTFVGRRTYETDDPFEKEEDMLPPDRIFVFARG